MSCEDLERAFEELENKVVSQNEFRHRLDELCSTHMTRGEKLYHATLHKIVHAIKSLNTDAKLLASRRTGYLNDPAPGLWFDEDDESREYFNKGYLEIDFKHGKSSCGLKRAFNEKCWKLSIQAFKECKDVRERADVAKRLQPFDYTT